MIIYSSLRNLSLDKPEEAKTFANYSELLAAVKPDLTWNGHYYDIAIHSEEELEKIPDDHPSHGTENFFRGWEMNEHTKELYDYNRIYDWQRELIPAGWKKLRFVIGWHNERHVKSGGAIKVWNEKLWSVVGIVACDWPGKEEAK